MYHVPCVQELFTTTQNKNHELKWGVLNILEKFEWVYPISEGGATNPCIMWNGGAKYTVTPAQFPPTPHFLGLQKTTWNCTVTCNSIFTFFRQARSQVGNRGVSRLANLGRAAVKQPLLPRV